MIRLLTDEEKTIVANDLKSRKNEDLIALSILMEEGGLTTVVELIKEELASRGG